MRALLRYREAWLLLAIAALIGLVSLRFPAFASPDNLAQIFNDTALLIMLVLGQMLAPGVCAIRFAKGLDSHEGLYPHMFRHFCRESGSRFGAPVAWLNFEQDLGIPGFRRSKMSYRPAALLSKLRLAPVA